MGRWKDLIYEEESYKIRGAANEVARILCTGMHEMVYGDALEEEFRLRNIPCVREKTFFLNYKGVVLKHTFTCDFVCYDKIIVELKATKEIEDMHRSQILNYLHYTGMRLGLLFNFGERPLGFERFVL